ncbi:MAG: hypothetical protein JWR75_107 [Devosia sp.]|nr:hypothetical protein [Devosia sp.]
MNILTSYFRHSARQRTLRQLQSMPAYLLQDIGLNHFDLSQIARGDSLGHPKAARLR